MGNTAFTVDDMRRFASEAWGELGSTVVDSWCGLNAAYFDGALRPIPIVITNTQPYGRRIGLCSYGGSWRQGRCISLNAPMNGGFLLADNGTLLHEMVHQFLQDRGENSKHAGAPWRREIMRLNESITGHTIWAGQYKQLRRNGKPTWLNMPNPETGEASLTQTQIARWPHKHFGIDLGSLGQVAGDSV